jgi:hypothetical protein
MRFSKANTKLKQLHDVQLLQQYLEHNRKVYSFDLLSGHSCPFAEECLSKAVTIDNRRRIKDGPKTKFRCFSASQEAVFPSTYNLRKGNFDELRKLDDPQDMAYAICDSMPRDLGVARIHVGGDFFNFKYFAAWCFVAIRNPGKLFYAYTKSLEYWLRLIDDIPENLILTASRGGRLDHLIDEHNLREAKVVFSQSEADSLGLQIDHDDSHAAIPSLRDESFALLIHGQQPRGSEASEAIKQLKRDKVAFSYGKAGIPKQEVAV